MTSSTKEKGYSSSSHYRISSEFEQSEQVLATKFVHWDAPPLESLSDSSIYLLKAKLNCGERMSREDKDWLCEVANNNTCFRSAVLLQGWRFDFYYYDLLFLTSRMPFLYPEKSVKISTFESESLYLAIMPFCSQNAEVRLFRPSLSSQKMQSKFILFPLGPVQTIQQR